jgi:hypothetical protein
MYPATKEVRKTNADLQYQKINWAIFTYSNKEPKKIKKKNSLKSK